MPKGLLSYIVILSPEVKNSRCLREFRPISLLGSLYKMLSKGVGREVIEGDESDYFYILIGFFKKKIFGGWSFDC